MPLRKSRSLAVIAAAAAGGLAAFALRPSSGQPSSALAARNPAVEVRTQVIRRTIHVVRHEPALTRRGVRQPTSTTFRTTVRSGSSGSHHGASAIGAGSVATRTSGSHGTGSSGPPGPVTTRTSASRGATGSPSHPVTRSSGATGSPSHPVTRSSGGHHDDGGGDGGSDN